MFRTKTKIGEGLIETQQLSIFHDQIENKKCAICAQWEHIALIANIKPTL